MWPSLVRQHDRWMPQIRGLSHVKKCFFGACRAALIKSHICRDDAGVRQLYTDHMPYAQDLAPLASAPSPIPSPKPRILCVEDDAEIARMLYDILAENGFEPCSVGSAADMDALLNSSSVDLIILDVMLPGEDGLSICRRLRAASSIPIIMVTARDEDIDRIVGLEIGADDYVTKPFNSRELVARIRALLRRA